MGLWQGVHLTTRDGSSRIAGSALHFKRLGALALFPVKAVFGFLSVLNALRYGPEGRQALCRISADPCPLFRGMALNNLPVLP